MRLFTAYPPDTTFVPMVQLLSAYHITSTAPVENNLGAGAVDIYGLQIVAFAAIRFDPYNKYYGCTIYFGRFLLKQVAWYTIKYDTYK